MCGLPVQLNGITINNNEKKDMKERENEHGTILPPVIIVSLIFQSYEPRTMTNHPTPYIYTRRLYNYEAFCCCFEWVGYCRAFKVTHALFRKKRNTVYRSRSLRFQNLFFTLLNTKWKSITTDFTHVVRVGNVNRCRDKWHSAFLGPESTPLHPEWLYPLITSSVWIWHPFRK